MHLRAVQSSAVQNTMYSSVEYCTCHQYVLEWAGFGTSVPAVKRDDDHRHDAIMMMLCFLHGNT